MAITVNIPFRNAQLNSTDLSSAFDNGKLRIYSGSKPATANLAPTGTLLVEITLPADAFAAVANGAMAKNGTWSDASANATGTAGWFRLSAASDDDTLDGNFARLDGTVTATGGGGDLTVDSTSITAAQSYTQNSFTITAPAS